MKRIVFGILAVSILLVASILVSADDSSPDFFANGRPSGEGLISKNPFVFPQAPSGAGVDTSPSGSSSGGSHGHSRRSAKARVCKGDMNGDGFLTIVDTSLFMNAVRCSYDSAFNARADVNGDGRINGGDIDLLMNFISGSETPLVSDVGIRGDITGDGMVTQADLDAFSLVNSCDGAGKLYDSLSLWKADIDGNGVRDAMDIGFYFAQFNYSQKKLVCA